jgi:glycosyltransferase involved in cell wall biosynthesis
LEQTVRSVLDSGVVGLEYLIIDGASTDTTVEYLESLDASTVRFISEPDDGIADAMNKGIRLARGQWVLHLHAGDRLLPGMLSNAMAQVEGADADIVCCAIVKNEAHGVVRYEASPQSLASESSVPHPGVIARTDVWRELGGFNPAYRNAMDYDLFLRARLAGKRFRVIDEPLAVMAWGGQSEQSLWRTLRETHTIRRTLLTSGFARSPLFLLLLFVRGTVRSQLQRFGLHRVVSFYRRHFSAQKKEPLPPIESLAP